MHIELRPILGHLATYQPQIQCQFELVNACETPRRRPWLFASVPHSDSARLLCNGNSTGPKSKEPLRYVMDKVQKVGAAPQKTPVKATNGKTENPPVTWCLHPSPCSHLSSRSVAGAFPPSSGTSLQRATPPRERAGVTEHLRAGGGLP